MFFQMEPRVRSWNTNPESLRSAVPSLVQVHLRDFWPDGTGFLRQKQIWFPIAIEIRHHDLETGDVRLQVGFSKATLSIACEQDDRLLNRDSQQVRMAIAIEVARGKVSEVIR